MSDCGCCDCKRLSMNLIGSLTIGLHSDWDWPRPTETMSAISYRILLRLISRSMVAWPLMAVCWYFPLALTKLLSQTKESEFTLVWFHPLMLVCKSVVLVTRLVRKQHIQGLSPSHPYLPLGHRPKHLPWALGSFWWCFPVHCSHLSYCLPDVCDCVHNIPNQNSWGGTWVGFQEQG